MKTLLIAHRGDTVNFPENTIEAFESAFEKGADGIELDLQFHDGKLITVHDYLFDKSKTYPFISQILECFVNKGRIEIEVKSLDLDFLSPFKNLLDQYKDRDIEITTSVFPLVGYIHEALPDIPIGVIFHEKEFEEWMTEEFIIMKVVKMMVLFKAQRAHLPNKFLNRKMIEVCHANEFQVHGHIYRKPTEQQIALYKQFNKLGVDQCTIDDVTLLDNLV